MSGRSHNLISPYGFWSNLTQQNLLFALVAGFIAVSGPVCIILLEYNKNNLVFQQWTLFSSTLILCLVVLLFESAWERLFWKGPRDHYCQGFGINWMFAVLFRLDPFFDSITFYLIILMWRLTSSSSSVLKDYENQHNYFFHIIDVPLWVVILRIVIFGLQHFIWFVLCIISFIYDNQWFALFAATGHSVPGDELNDSLNIRIRFLCSWCLCRLISFPLTIFQHCVAFPSFFNAVNSLNFPLKDLVNPRNHDLELLARSWLVPVLIYGFIGLTSISLVVIIVTICLHRSLVRHILIPSVENTGLDRPPSFILQKIKSFSPISRQEIRSTRIEEQLPTTESNVFAPNPSASHTKHADHPNVKSSSNFLFHSPPVSIVTNMQHHRVNSYSVKVDASKASRIPCILQSDSNNDAYRIVFEVLRSSKFPFISAFCLMLESIRLEQKQSLQRLKENSNFGGKNSNTITNNNNNNNNNDTTNQHCIKLNNNNNDIQNIEIASPSSAVLLTPVSAATSNSEIIISLLEDDAGGIFQNINTSNDLINEHTNQNHLQKLRNQTDAAGDHVQDLSLSYPLGSSDLQGFSHDIALELSVTSVSNNGDDPSHISKVQNSKMHSATAARNSLHSNEIFPHSPFSIPVATHAIPANNRSSLCTPDSHYNNNISPKSSFQSEAWREGYIPTIYGISNSLNNFPSPPLFLPQAVNINDDHCMQSIRIKGGNIDDLNNNCADGIFKQAFPSASAADYAYRRSSSLPSPSKQVTASIKCNAFLASNKMDEPIFKVNRIDLLKFLSNPADFRHSKDSSYQVPIDSHAFASQNYPTDFQTALIATHSLRIPEIRSLVESDYLFHTTPLVRAVLNFFFFSPSLLARYSNIVLSKPPAPPIQKIPPLKISHKENVSNILSTCMLHPFFSSALNLDLRDACDPVAASDPSSNQYNNGLFSTVMHEHISPIDTWRCRKGGWTQEEILTVAGKSLKRALKRSPAFEASCAFIMMNSQLYSNNTKSFVSANSNNGNAIPEHDEVGSTTTEPIIINTALNINRPFSASNINCDEQNVKCKSMDSQPHTFHSFQHSRMISSHQSPNSSTHSHISNSWAKILFPFKVFTHLKTRRLRRIVGEIDGRLSENNDNIKSVDTARMMVSWVMDIFLFAEGVKHLPGLKKMLTRIPKVVKVSGL